jgi:hypothetical protein
MTLTERARLCAFRVARHRDVSSAPGDSGSAKSAKKAVPTAHLDGVGDRSPRGDLDVVQRAQPYTQ